jgi:hypothetical protein
MAVRGAALAVLTALLAPATASAATTIGSALSRPANGVEQCADPGGCTIVQTQLLGLPVKVPYDGVLVSWGARAFAGGLHPPIDFRVLRPGAGGAVTAVATDADRILPSDGGTGGGATRVKVRAGDMIGVDLDPGDELGSVGPGSFATSSTFIPKLGAGETRTPSSTDQFADEFLLQATVEHDVDGDGYGDETQDGCPQLAERQTACPRALRVGYDRGSSFRLLGVPTIVAGHSFTIGLTVSNPEFYREPGVVLKLTFPAEIAPLSVQAPVQLGTLGPGQAVTLRVKARALRPGPTHPVKGAPAFSEIGFQATSALPPPRLDLSSGSATVAILPAGACRNRFSLRSASGAFKGTPGGDRLTAARGGATVLGLDGDDCLKGSRGRDVLRAGAGDDRLDGGRGRDVLEGGPGKDFIRAVDARRDVVRCGPGRDRARVDRFDSVSGCELVTPAR